MLKAPFSPPDINEEEINEVVEALKRGSLQDQRQKNLIRLQHLSMRREAVSLNSATASELALHFLGIGPGDEVITAPIHIRQAPVVCVGAKLVLQIRLPILRDGL
ncbi:MAG: DegT/DnrJ/EryC1/StrS family aminotransferase [Eisenbergiella sp.]